MRGGALPARGTLAQLTAWRADAVWKDLRASVRAEVAAYMERLRLFQGML
ncbi:hypothetical protein M622_02240 [Thauera terpenica 58Eu]|jgi:hypothetical protein|uniref:Uncharacterized protein n=1 Tax=Thauera terpenica 58Eu TaxID=1348657 RepID=T0AT60_9RHOO|nr:hypothetical protein M622_02240 [Thauera terpenica 58Eu]